MVSHDGDLNTIRAQSRLRTGTSAGRVLKDQSDVIRIRDIFIATSRRLGDPLKSSAPASSSVGVVSVFFFCRRGGPLGGFDFRHRWDWGRRIGCGVAFFFRVCIMSSFLLFFKDNVLFKMNINREQRVTNVDDSTRRVIHKLVAVYR